MTSRCRMLGWNWDLFHTQKKEENKFNGNLYFILNRIKFLFIFFLSFSSFRLLEGKFKENMKEKM